MLQKNRSDGIDKRVQDWNVYDAGSGKFEINGQGVDYFESKYAR